MAIDPRQWIHKVGRIREDQIKISVDARAQIALHNFYILAFINSRIDPAKPKCTLVDVRKHDERRASRCKRGGVEPTGPGSGANVENSRRDTAVLALHRGE